MSDAPQITLESWSGPWADDDRDANFKQEVAQYSQLDPLSTIGNLAGALDIPVGSVCRYILAKWASAGAEAIMALGPTAITRLAAAIDQAEDADTDEARLAAYHDLRLQVSWLKVPLEDPAAYPDPGA